MRWPTWWQVLLALLVRSLAQSATPTVCDEDVCRCDSFTTVICNCSTDHSVEITLRPDGAYRVPSTATGIIIDGCARATFLSGTVRHLIHLRRIELSNVDHVVINERAIAWSPFSTENEMNPGLRITINNCIVDEISSHAIQGRIDEIIISNSNINSIKPFAFSSITGIKTVELSDNVFQNIDIQPFKKFSTLNFVLRGGSINTLPSRFLSDVEVTNLFRVDGVTVNFLSSLTFLVSGPKRVLIENNNIQTLEGDGFHIITRGPVTFRNNTVNDLRKGAFYGFNVEHEITSTLGTQEMLIDNNTVTNLSPASLMYQNRPFRLRLDGLNLNVTCACGLAEEWKELMKEQGGTIACWYALEDHYVSLPTFIDSRCGTFKQTFWIFVLIGIILILIVVAVAIFFIVKREVEKNQRVQIVMPDGKTYRETEFHIVVERAELLTTDL